MIPLTYHFANNQRRRGRLSDGPDEIGGTMTAGFSMATHERTPFDGRKSCVSAEGVESVLSFHRGLPGYAPTPLVELPALAKALGVAQILVKDESKRFGLNAFKALGCSYAIAGWLCRTFGLALNENTFARLRPRPVPGPVCGRSPSSPPPTAIMGGALPGRPGFRLPGGGLYAQGKRPGTSGQHPRPGRGGGDHRPELR